MMKKFKEYFKAQTQLPATVAEWKHWHSLHVGDELWSQSVMIDRHSRGKVRDGLIKLGATHTLCRARVDYPSYDVYELAGIHVMVGVDNQLIALEPQRYRTIIQDYKEKT